MLIVAGILFILALFFLFVDKWFEHAGMDLRWVYCLLFVASAVLIILKFYLFSKPT